jgi:hypothetical protein
LLRNDSGGAMTDQPYVHPAFPQPNDPSIVIWRYMDAPKFEWLINCGRLFMASADRLGDPLEGSTPESELEWRRRQSERADTDEVRSVIEPTVHFGRGWPSNFAPTITLAAGA